MTSNEILLLAAFAFLMVAPNIADIIRLAVEE